METNQTPKFDLSKNETGCCPRFDPTPWDRRDLHFVDKPFVKASTVSFFHIPLNMGSMFERTWAAIRSAHADTGEFLVLSHDDTAWHAEHLFAVSKEVPGAELVRLNGDYVTKVFEGPISDAKKWAAAMETVAIDKGKQLEKVYFFHTTCPRCAKHYGKNYVVGIARVS